MISLQEPPQDARVLRDVYACFPTGVTVVCALDSDAPVGMSATSFTPVSIVPPLVSLCIRRDSRTWRRLRTASRIGISVLGVKHDDACRKLSAREGDRFAGVEWNATAAGAVFIAGAVAWMECSLHREIDAGDHTIALLRIEALGAEPAVKPLIFHRSRYCELASE